MTQTNTKPRMTSQQRSVWITLMRPEFFFEISPENWSRRIFGDVFLRRYENPSLCLARRHGPVAAQANDWISLWRRISHAIKTFTKTKGSKNQTTLHHHNNKELGDEDSRTVVCLLMIREGWTGQKRRARKTQLIGPLRKSGTTTAIIAGRAVRGAWNPTTSKRAKITLHSKTQISIFERGKQSLGQIGDRSRDLLQKRRGGDREMPHLRVEGHDDLQVFRHTVQQEARHDEVVGAVDADSRADL